MIIMLCNCSFILFDWLNQVELFAIGNQINDIRKECHLFQKWSNVLMIMLKWVAWPDLVGIRPSQSNGASFVAIIAKQPVVSICHHPPAHIVSNGQGPSPTHQLFSSAPQGWVSLSRSRPAPPHPRSGSSSPPAQSCPWCSVLLLSLFSTSAT